ncbi:hypothetical protein U9M48_005224 [Paspalum notatum var. saurae]|uniref:Retrovirus-related Pol polyprotein from transposon TNT 1-94-like beta-barrel domain-containing protein n=1 Tax=Paspalum notatum var. saurae TaxID=547442 RepID=A0AAQ3PQD4_PASNO
MDSALHQVYQYHHGYSLPAAAASGDHHALYAGRPRSMGAVNSNDDVIPFLAAPAGWLIRLAAFLGELVASAVLGLAFPVAALIGALRALPAAAASSLRRVALGLLATACTFAALFLSALLGFLLVRHWVEEPETRGSVQYPMLTRTNYQEWSLLMRVNLEVAGLWHAVEPEEDDVIEYREDRLAMAAILRSIPSDMLGSLARKRTARSAWEAVKTHRMGVERVREASTRQLLKDFGEITFRDGELVGDFALRITGLANNIRTLGGTISDTDIVKKMIQVAPPHLEQIACPIETLLDVNTLTVEELTGRLRAIEQHKKKPPPLTPAPEGAVYDKQGHWAKDCCSKKKAAQAHVAEGDEEDSTLLMATTIVSIGEPAPAADEQGALVPHRVRLLEAKVVPRLDAPEERNDCRWILDMGASNHMTGVRSLFSELDKGINGTVRFGDGSTMAIEGRGTIVFACKNGEQRTLTGVYYIPRLTANIISVG